MTEVEVMKKDKLIKKDKNSKVTRKEEMPKKLVARVLLGNASQDIKDTKNIDYLNKIFENEDQTGGQAPINFLPPNTSIVYGLENVFNPVEPHETNNLTSDIADCVIQQEPISGSSLFDL